MRKYLEKIGIRTGEDAAFAVFMIFLILFLGGIGLAILAIIFKVIRWGFGL